MGNFAQLVLFLVLSTGLIAAQETPAASQGQPKTSAGAPESSQSTEKELQKKEQSQRILGVMPQFGVTNRQNAAPLTPKQKFHLFAKGTIDPFNFVVIGIQAGISQGSDSFEGYGQGAEGYFKRYGAAFTDSMTSGFFSNFFYPVLFKEDPRYFRLGHGSVKHRIGYALVQEFVCHTDKGGRSFHFSNVLGAFTSGGISNAYYPEADRGFELTMSRSGIALMYGSLGGLLNEFWPDIDRKFIHKDKK